MYGLNYAYTYAIVLLYLHCTLFIEEFMENKNYLCGRDIGAGCADRCKINSVIVTLRHTLSLADGSHTVYVCSLYETLRNRKY